jgi:hypothetical protein
MPFNYTEFAIIVEEPDNIIHNYFSLKIMVINIRNLHFRYTIDLNLAVDFAY